MLTRPKLILPFQIARITYKLRGSAAGRAFLDVEALAAASAYIPYLRCRFQLLAANAVQLVKPDERFFDEIVRAGSARGDAHHDPPARQPVLRDDFLLLVQIVVKN